MKCPDKKVLYGSICKKFPECCVYFSTYEEAVNWAKFDQPDHRPYYIVKSTETFEICGKVNRSGKVTDWREK